jgi:hypothetical protein
MKRLTIVLLGAFAAGVCGVVGVACGGVGGGVLFGGAGGSGPGGDGSTSGSSNGSASSSSGHGGATSSGSSGSVASSSGAASSSSSAAASSSSSNGSALPPVICDNGGSTTCAAGEVCCYNETPGVADSCAQPGHCAAGFVELSCSGPSDCPGGICCATGMFVGPAGQQEFLYSGISCQTTCPPIGESGFAICSGPASTECGAGKQCIASNLLPPIYYVCN